MEIRPSDILWDKVRREIISDQLTDKVDLQAATSERHLMLT